MVFERQGKSCHSIMNSLYIKILLLSLLGSREDQQSLSVFYYLYIIKIFLLLKNTISSLFLPREYRDHRGMLDPKALRESRSEPCEQLLLTSPCTSAVNLAADVPTGFNKRLELSNLYLSVNRSLREHLARSPSVPCHYCDSPA